MTDATVIMAAWNAEATLEHSLRSALAQANVDLEIIVVDDGSTDATLVAARTLAAREPRLHVIGLARNLGPGAARNRAIEQARGEWIAVLDADDAMAAERLSRLVGLGRERDVDIVLGNHMVVTGRGDRGLPFLPASGDPAPRQWSLREYVEGNLWDRSSPGLGYLKPLIRRRFLKASGLRYDESLRNSEDFFLIVEAMASGARVLYAPEPLYFYTQREGSLSHRLDPRYAAALLRSEAGFLSRNGANLDQQVRRLFRRRHGALRDFVAAESTMRALRTGRLHVAVATMLRRPRAAPRLMQQLGEALRKRLPIPQRV